MEHTFKIEKELKITTENIVDCVLSCEAGGFDYWGELCSDEKDYEAARQRLAEREIVLPFCNYTRRCSDGKQIRFLRGLPPRKVSHGERGIHGKDTKPGAGTAGR